MDMEKGFKLFMGLLVFYIIFVYPGTQFALLMLG